jgi:hypothetical protein
MNRTIRIFVGENPNPAWLAADGGFALEANLPLVAGSQFHRRSVDDFSRVGALRFQDETDNFQRTAEEGRRTARQRGEA